MSVEDAFEFYGASLVSAYEHYFPGGETQILKITSDFLDVYKRNLETKNDTLEPQEELETKATPPKDYPE